MFNLSRPKKAINTIYDDQLETLLKNLGILNSIKQHKKKCKFCGERITLESISYIFPEAGDIKIVCDRPECIGKLIDHINKGKFDV